MQKIILTGGDDVGMSQVYGELKKLHPEYGYLPNPMQLVQDRETLIADLEPLYEQVTPTTDPIGFGGLAITRALIQQLEAAELSDETEAVIMRRSLVDMYGREMVLNRGQLLGRLERAIKASNFDFGIFLDADYSNREYTPWRSLTNNGFIAHAYDKFGITLVHIAYGDLDERVELVEKIIDRHLHENW